MKNKFSPPLGRNVQIFTGWCENETSPGGMFYPYRACTVKEALENYDFSDVVVALENGDVALAGHLLNRQVLNYAMDSVRRAAIMDGVGYESDS